LARDAKGKSGLLPRWNQFRHGLTVADNALAAS